MSNFYEINETETLYDLLKNNEEEKNNLIKKLKEFFSKIITKYCNKDLNFEKIILTSYCSDDKARISRKINVYLTPFGLKYKSNMCSNLIDFDYSIINNFDYELLKEIINNIDINFIKRELFKNILEKENLIQKVDNLINEI